MIRLTISPRTAEAVYAVLKDPTKIRLEGELSLVEDFMMTLYQSYADTEVEGDLANRALSNVIDARSRFTVQAKRVLKSPSLTDQEIIRRIDDAINEGMRQEGDDECYEAFVNFCIDSGFRHEDEREICISYGYFLAGYATGGE